MGILYLILDLVLAFVVMIITHEFGHWAYFSILLNRPLKIGFNYDYKKGFEINIGEDKDYYGMNKHHKFNGYAAGVIFGLMFLVYLLIFGVIYLVLLPFYVYGCRNDLLVMWRLFKTIRRNGLFIKGV